MSLLLLQRDMRAWLRLGGEEEAACFPRSARDGLGIYQNNYRAQLVGCLETSFPVTREWVGADAFHVAVVEHIDSVPPSSWTLDAYPRDFPATLQRLFPQDPEIAELARLEVTLAEVFVAADADRVTAERLADVDWDHAVLRFTPSLDLSSLTTNAPAIWSAIVENTSPPAAETLAAPGALVTWRHDQLSHFRAVDQAEMHAILRARSGSSFAALCASLAERLGEEDGVATAGGWLGQWIADGLISDVLDARSGRRGG